MNEPFPQCKIKRVEDLLGRTLVAIKGATKNSEQIELADSEGGLYRLYHDQDCCESVEVEDVVGDMQDLLHSPLTMAEVSSNSENPPSGADSHTWTFYKFATLKGYVTIRWYGESNGCYSERVDFACMNPPNDFKQSMNEPSDPTDQPPASRLTPQEINSVVDNIQANGVTPPPPVPPPLTPSMIEGLMDRMLLTPTIVEMCTHTRDGEHDLGPLSGVVLECTLCKSGDQQAKTMAFAITVQLATWAIATYQRVKGGAL